MFAVIDLLIGAISITLDLIYRAGDDFHKNLKLDFFTFKYFFHVITAP